MHTMFYKESIKFVKIFLIFESFDPRHLVNDSLNSFNLGTLAETIFKKIKIQGCSDYVQELLGKDET